MSVSWVLTALFAAACVWFLAGRADAGLAHAGMGAAMIVMAWPWAMSIPMWPQIAVFGAAALWFAGRATVPRRAAGLRDTHHALMAAAMVWMAVVMHRPALLPSTAVLAWYFVLAAPALTFSSTDAGPHALMSVATGVLLLDMS